MNYKTTKLITELRRKAEYLVSIGINDTPILLREAADALQASEGTTSSALTERQLTYPEAREIAFRAAKAFKPCYFSGDDFEPHPWVVHAVISGSSQPQRKAAKGEDMFSRNSTGKASESAAVPVAYTTGHCKEHGKAGGCQLHNLQCGYPDCDRKAVSAAPQPPAPAKPLPLWIPVSERLPGHPPVLAGFFDKYSGKFKVIKAAWVAKHTEEIGASDFQGDEDYDAETDTCYWPEGWYEWNEFEETHWLVGQPITHWMPLPKAPITKEQP